jgi:hypothetical protein
VIDLGQGWRTGRLDLEPLAVAYAAELAPLLDDPRMDRDRPHPSRHLASQGVARAAGLSPTGDVHHGEVCWASSPAAAP